MIARFTRMHARIARQMRKPVGFLICLFLLTGLVAQAQIQVVPIYRPGKVLSPSSARTTPPTSTVPSTPQPHQTGKTLPFFDDFSLYSGTPLPDNWMPGSGVDINNSLAINHPSRNVATFNGLNAKGIPYDTLSELTYGGTDTLTSILIDLKNLQPGQYADSIRLSFFWQARGLGELPDAEDSLVLQFKDVNGLWTRVKAFQGQVINNYFKQENIPVQNPIYHHPGFQFRFLAYGKRSGAFDIWNIDYVYLNTPRKPGNFFLRDVACQRNVNSFLKQYTAMPLQHYKKDPARETAASVRIEITNLNDNNNKIQSVYVMSNAKTNVIYQGPDTSKVFEIKEATLYPNNLTQQIVSAEVSSTALTNLTSLPNTTPVIIKQKFTILTKEVQDSTIVGFNFIFNDTISNFTVLDDYYAYDDGTAEYGAGINQRLGRIAVRYIIKDTAYIKGVNLYIPRIKKDLRGQSFVLQIFDNANGKPNKILYQASTPVTYSANQNQFTYFPLGFYTYDTTGNNKLILISVAVKDTFYVGWQQTTQDLLPVGLDKNTYFGNNIFYNMGTKTSDWQADTSIQGSFMVRPVMGKIATITGLDEEPVKAKALQVSPNPTTGVLSWNDARFTSAKVYDLGGRLLFSQTIKSQSTPQADLRFLQNGLYLLHLSNGKTTQVRKVVIAK